MGRRGLRAAALLLLLGCGGGGSSSLRLTQSSDPSPASPRANLTQWNWNRQIAVDDAGAVHVVWAQLGTTNVDLPADQPDPVNLAALPSGQLFYLRSDDGGRTWPAPRALTPAAAGVDSASVATSAANVYVVWRAPDAGRLRVFFARSGDGGATWTAPLPISDNPAGVSASAPALAATPTALHVVWPDGRTGVKEVYLASSADGGASFGSARGVSTPDGRSSWTPTVAAGAGAVHVAWTDERDDVGECTQGTNPCREEEYYRRSPDDGRTWGPELRLTTDPAGAPKESWAPSLALWGDSVHLAYLDKRSGDFQVYYRRSGDGGLSFGPERLVPSDAQFSNAARPTIAAREGVVHLTWFGFSTFEADVYHSRSDDDGATWSPFANLTSDGAGAARMPHVAIAPDHSAHVVWYDTRLSDASGARIELFYAHPSP